MLFLEFLCFCKVMKSRFLWYKNTSWGKYMIHKYFYTCTTDIYMVSQQYKTTWKNKLISYSFWTLGIFILVSKISPMTYNTQLSRNITYWSNILKRYFLKNIRYNDIHIFNVCPSTWLTFSLLICNQQYNWKKTAQNIDLLLC